MVKPEPQHELSKSECLAVGIDSLTKIRFCETLRHELANQDRAGQMAAQAFQNASREINLLTRTLIDTATQSNVLTHQLQGVAAAANFVASAQALATQLQAGVQRLAQLSALVAAAGPHLEQVGSYLRATADRTSNLFVLGQAYENLVTQLKKYSEARSDPLSHFAALAEASHFADPRRFTAVEAETILMEDDVLISMTDLAGKITFANDTFCRLAEYSNTALVGAPHNIVRHPDMPKEVFADLWKNLRAGKMWQGVVKNRSRTGRFYWVLAAVFPHCHGEQIVGYISVRVKPHAALLPRAIQTYRRLR